MEGVMVKKNLFSLIWGILISSQFIIPAYSAPDENQPLEFVNSGSEGNSGDIKKVSILEENSTRYIDLTQEGFPGAITLRQRVLFENALETVQGRTSQFVAIQDHAQFVSLIKGSEIFLYALNHDTGTLEVTNAHHLSTLLVKKGNPPFVDERRPIDRGYLPLDIIIKIEISENTNGKNILITTEGFPGSIGIEEKVIFEKRIGDKIYYISLRETGLLSLGQIHLIEVNESSVNVTFRSTANPEENKVFPFRREESNIIAEEKPALIDGNLDGIQQRYMREFWTENSGIASVGQTKDAEGRTALSVMVINEECIKRLPESYHGVRVVYRIGKMPEPLGTPPKGQEKEGNSHSDREKVYSPLPSRKALAENAQGLAKIWIAEEIKELWFSLTEDPERFVEFNKKLIESPESVFSFLASYEGFVLAEKATQRALGLQNGQSPDIRFLEKWPRVHAFSKVLVRSVPMAMGVTVMESLRKMMENKKLMEQLDQATLLERELFYVQVNNAILQALILYANSACDALMDPETYRNGLKIASELTAAGALVHYGKKTIQLGRFFCTGAKVRATVEAGSMTPPGWIAATVELTATFIIAEYLDVALNSLISWWQEYSLRSNLENAKRKVREIKGAARSEESDYVAALREMKGAFKAYEAYLKKDVLIALLQGDRLAKIIEEYYNERIEKIRKREPIQVYGNFEAYAMAKMITQFGKLEERYERTDTGWRIIRTPIFYGKPSEGATGYWGGVWTPAQKIEMTDQEFKLYANNIVKENEQNRNSTIERILSVANQNALTIAKRIFGTEVDPEDSGRITMRNLGENQIQFLQSLE